MRVRVSTSALTVGLAVLVALPALAAEGRRPIWFSGQVITTPGKYFVSRNLPANAAGPAITVLAPRVDLDLNGMEIDQAANLADPAIHVAGGVTEVRIHNGAVLGGLHAIRTDPGRKVVIEGIHALGSAAESILLEDVDSQVIRNNVIIECQGGAGIRLVGGALKNGAIEDNTIRFCNGGSRSRTARR